MHPAYNCLAKNHLIGLVWFGTAGSFVDLNFRELNYFAGLQYSVVANSGFAFLHFLITGMFD